MRVRSCKIKTIQFNQSILHYVILGWMQNGLDLVQLQSCRFTPFISPERLFHPLVLQSVRFAFCPSDSRPMILKVLDLLLTLELSFAVFSCLPQAEVVASSSDVTLW